MRRTLLNRRNSLLSRPGAWLGLIALAVVLIIVLLRLIFPSITLAAEAPFLQLSDSLSTSIGNFYTGFDNASKLAAERDALVASNATLTEENATLSAKVSDLEDLLGTEPSTAPGIIAGVLARPPETAYDTLVVGAGSSAGIVVGDVAYTQSSLPVGVVTAVSGGAARITLLSASNESTDAWVGATRVPVTLLGAGSGTFIAQASRAASTTVGDAVYVSGPGALPIGQVAAVSGDPSSPFITLEVQDSVDIFSLPYVLIKHVGPDTWPAIAPEATTTAP
jgi:cell shape-determining protein MreC